MKSLTKISAIALLAGAVVCAPIFTSCQKQVIDIHTTLPDNEETINVPGTDIASITELINTLIQKLTANETEQITALINAIAGDNEDLKAQLVAIVDQLKKNQEATDQELTEIKSQLSDVIKAINALNDDLTKKIQDAITAINEQNNKDVVAAIEAAQKALKQASDENAQNIINALNSNYTNILAELKKAVEILNNAEISKNFEEIEKLLKADDPDAATIIEKLNTLIDQMAELLNATMSASAKADSIEDIEFVPSSEVPQESETTVEYSENVANFTNEGGVLYAAQVVAVPNEGAEKYSAEQIQALYDAVENDMKVVPATKAGEIDLIQAKSLLKNKIAALPTSWTATTNVTYEITVNKENVTEVIIGANTDATVEGIVVWTELNSNIYYVVGTRTVAGKTGNPTFTIKTSEGTTSHDGTSHTGHSGHSGHGEEGNAGGGISGK